MRFTSRCIPLDLFMAVQVLPDMHCMHSNIIAPGSAVIKNPFYIAARVLKYVGTLKNKDPGIA